MPSPKKGFRALLIGLGGVALVATAIAVWVLGFAAPHEPSKKTTKEANPAYFAQCRYHDKTPTELGALLVQRGYPSISSSENADMKTELHVKGDVAVTLIYQRAGAFVGPGAGNEDAPRASRLVLSAPPCSLTVLVGGPSIPAGEAARLMGELAPEPARP